jgi:uncharacterized protein YacL
MTVEILAAIGMVVAYLVGNIVAHRTANGGNAMLEAIIVGIVIMLVLGYFAHRLGLL